MQGCSFFKTVGEKLVPGGVAEILPSIGPCVEECARPQEYLRLRLFISLMIRSRESAGSSFTQFQAIVSRVWPGVKGMQSEAGPVASYGVKGRRGGSDAHTNAAYLPR
jgi:hypothetical protein